MASVIAATAVTALILLAVALAINYGIDWRSHSIVPYWEPEGEHEGVLSTFLHSPLVWAVAFVGVALGVTALTLAAAGGFGLSVPGGLLVAAAPFAVLVLAFLLAGTYAAVRGRQVSPAGATLASALVVGFLLLLAITVNLLVGV